MVEQSKTNSDPFWILINSGDSFKVISQNDSGQSRIKDSDETGGLPKILVIEKKNCKIYEKSILSKLIDLDYSASDERLGLQNPISGLLGILNIQGQNFIVVITEKQMIGKIEGANIFLIKNVDLIPFYDDFMQINQIRNYIDGVKKLLLSGFYFSYNSDLTSNRQRSAKIRNQALVGGDGQSIWDTCDQRYFWNYNICQDFLFQKVDPRWIVPIIQGYVEYQSQVFDGKELEILLISRRRHAQSGTRYNARGLDDEGNVANYVETEQILSYKNNIYSFVQIRGSVPLFWQQKGISAHTSIKRDNELTAQAFDKHLSDMVNDYRLVIFINLLQKARSYEYMLTQALEQLFQMSQPKCVKYTYFDFHTETKGDNFHRLNDLMIKIEDMLVKKFLYFIEDRNTGKIIQEQKGVFRTNCLDCLDRTNVTQTKIALKILEIILDRIKTQNQHSKFAAKQNQQSYAMLGFDNNNGDAYVFDVLKNMWAENGDVISKQYAGTSSTITKVTKTGKQGFMGKIDQMRRGVERFLVNNIEDGLKHECIKLLINKHPQQQQYGVRASLERHLEKYQSHFISWSNITVSVVTWNCAGNTPPPTFDITNILHYGGDPNIVPDVFVIGLQEMVKLNAKSVIQGKDRERALLWERIITNSLCKKSKYVCVSRKPMVGCFILLYIRDIHKDRINQIRTSKVKTGFGGQSGNKGAVAIRFNFDNSSFAFINCHLSSGQSQISERLEDLREIYKKSFDCSQKYQDFMIQSHDYKFIFGDLNFRIALPYETCKEEVRKRNYKYLQSKDQLLQVKSQNAILNRFNEGELNFDPTFKYDDHSNSYDTSQKRRVPSWCDRVLYEKSSKCNGQIDLLHYGRRESYFSDHRPVNAIFTIKVCKIDQEKKREIELKLLDQLFPGTLQQARKSIASQQAVYNDNANQVNSQFNLMQINIQEGYVDQRKSIERESSSNGETKAIDDLLKKESELTQSQAIDELLKSNVQTSQVEDLISLSPGQSLKENMKSADDLIDLNFNSSQSNELITKKQSHQLQQQNSFPPQNQSHSQQMLLSPGQQLYQQSSFSSGNQLTYQNMYQGNNNVRPQAVGNQTFQIQNSYFNQFGSGNINQPQQQQPFQPASSFITMQQQPQMIRPQVPIMNQQPQSQQMINPNQTFNNQQPVTQPLTQQPPNQQQQLQAMTQFNTQNTLTSQQQPQNLNAKSGSQVFEELFGDSGNAQNTQSNNNNHQSNHFNQEQQKKLENITFPVQKQQESQQDVQDFFKF